MPNYARIDPVANGWNVHIEPYDCYGNQPMTNLGQTPEVPETFIANTLDDALEIVRQHCGHPNDSIDDIYAAATKSASGQSSHPGTGRAIR